MQYFKNTPRRASEYPGAREIGMYPLCRNDMPQRGGGMRDMPQNCAPMPKEEPCPTYPERGAGCGCKGAPLAERARVCEEANENARRENAPCPEHDICTGLAMAFVPDHEFDGLYDCEEALCRGSLFRQLDMPFFGQKRRGCK